MGKHYSDHAPAHTPLSKLPSHAWKCAPSGYAWVWSIAQSLPFSQVLAPLVPATRVLFVYSHSFRASLHSGSQLHQTYSLAQWHLFPGGPFPSHSLWAFPALGGFPAICQSSVYSALHKRLRILEDKDSLDSFAPIE